jgi:predicted O-methyltransferase YrrM
VAVGLALPEKARLPADDVVVRESLPEHVSAEPSDAVMAFDEHLLERARTQWQLGDWQSLASLHRDTIQHHPDRAKLALLAAAGRLQTGQDAEARQFARLAKDWGVGKRLISQILIAGVHNSIGRANAVGNQPHRALQHFENAINIGTPGADAGLTTQARAAEQLHQLGLPTPRGISDAGASPTAISTLRLQPLSKGLEDISEALQNQKAEFDAQLKKQADELTYLHKSLDTSLKNQINNATKQIEATFGLLHYFANGDLPSVNTERHAWPVSPDFALYLVELLERFRYDLVIEFGSGYSTVSVAKALKIIASRRPGEHDVTFVSFEHLEQYLLKTQNQLEAAGLNDSVKLYLAPLQDWHAPDCSVQSFYACDPILADLAKNHHTQDLRLLVIVDGPPGNTCKHARYPAVPVILKHFAGAQIDILLDDYIRNEEKEIVKKWQSVLTTANLKYAITKRELERDACLIKVHSTNNF